MCPGRTRMIMERAMGIEPTSEAWEPSDTCGDEKFWCNFGAVKEGKEPSMFPQATPGKRFRVYAQLVRSQTLYPTELRAHTYTVYYQ